MAGSLKCSWTLDGSGELRVYGHRGHTHVAGVPSLESFRTFRQEINSYFNVVAYIRIMRVFSHLKSLWAHV